MVQMGNVPHVFEHLVLSWWYSLGEGLQSLGCKSLLKEELHWGQALTVYSLIPLPVLSLNCFLQMKT